jgi:hypothetical protein
MQNKGQTEGTTVQYSEAKHTANNSFFKQQKSNEVEKREHKYYSIK